MLKQLFIACLLPCLLLWGCSSDDGAPDGLPGQTLRSRTDAQREVVNPEVGSLLVRAQDAFHDGRYAMALALADSAEQREPGLADIPFLRGLILTDLNRGQEAEEAYRRVARLDPAYRGVWINLGNHASRHGKHRSALQFYQEELRYYPSPEVYKAIGVAYDELNEPDSARIAYRQAIEADSSYAVAHARLAQSYGRDGDYAEALRHARRAVAMEPENLHFQYYTGHLLLQLDEPAEAVNYLKPVADQLRWHRSAHHNLIQALDRLGRSSEARRYVAWSDTLQHVNEEIDLLLQLTTTYPERPEQWVSLAENLRRIGRLDEALEAYNKAVFLAPERIEWRNNTANLALAVGRVHRAIEIYRSILDENPALAEVWLNLGVAYARAGEREEARKAWEQTLALAPDHTRAQTFLAKLR